MLCPILHTSVFSMYPYRNVKLVTKPWLGSNSLPSLLPPWHKAVTRFPIGCKVVSRLWQPCNHLGQKSGFMHGLYMVYARLVPGPKIEGS